MSLITETGKSYFYQWDTNQVLIVEGEPNCREVHFGYRDGSFARVCQIREEDGRRVVDIPNELLQKDRTFFAYPISDEEDDAPMRTQSFVVLLRPKPDDYIHTEPEMQTYEALEKRITALEENGGTGSGTIKTVNGVTPDENGNVVITIPDAEVEIPNALPNPNALTLSGAVNATYDGSKAVSVEIPSGGGTLPEYDGTLLCEAVLPAGSEVGTLIPLGITMADLDEYSELYFKWSGASNTGLQNVYIMPSGANMTSGALMRSSHASVAALIVREFENPNIVTVYYGSGNPSTIYDPISKFAYFGNESQASLLYRTAARLDWSNINRVNELVINNSYTVPTIDYALKIYGIKRM